MLTSIFSLCRGSAIARIVGENVKKFDEFDDHVQMWVHEELVDGRKLTEIINTEHENVKYLKGYKIPENVVGTTVSLSDDAFAADVRVFVLQVAVADLLEAVKLANILIIVMPHQVLTLQSCNTCL